LVRIPGLQVLRFQKCCFVDDSIAVSSDSRSVECLAALSLFDCSLDGTAANIVALRPFKVLRICGGRPSPSGLEASHRDRIEDFVAKVCSLLRAFLNCVDLEDAWLSGQETQSLCDLLGAKDCCVRSLGLGGHVAVREEGQARKAPALSDEQVVTFFQRFFTFRCLRGLRIRHRVKTLDVACCIVAGLQSNCFLTRVNGLEFDAEGTGCRDFSKEILFWTWANRRGRSMVDLFLRRSTVPNGRVRVLNCLLSELLRRCSSAAASPSTAARDVPVLYHFVRQLAPAQLDGTASTKRGRKRPRSEEEEE
jgi:hypothetical protein